MKRLEEKLAYLSVYLKKIVYPLDYMISGSYELSSIETIILNNS